MIMPLAALDVGAHIGSHSAGLAFAVGSSGRVLAFEPQRGLGDVLAANAELTGLGNMDILRLAVGACPTRSQEAGPRGAGNASLSEANSEDDSVAESPAGGLHYLDPKRPRSYVPIPVVDVRSAGNATIPFWKNVTGSTVNLDSSTNYGGVSIVDTQRLLKHQQQPEPNSPARTAGHPDGAGSVAGVASLSARAQASTAGSAAGSGPEPQAAADASAGDSKADSTPGPEWVDWVESVCLDSLSLPKCPRVIKLDCEGMESQVSLRASS
jgi:FkbM family methyltransferase